jgi:23S rRNA (pseudouridine1915-N3)-methyltransferase
MIELIFIGKTRERFLQSGIEEYLKRLKRFTKLQVTELKSLDSFQKKNFLIIFDVKGRLYSSEDFAQVFKQLNKDITLLLGDENGLTDKIKKEADLIISISPMTFTHEFARLIIIEQIYRAFTIINNLKYHK